MYVQTDLEPQTAGINLAASSRTRAIRNRYIETGR
jgi:hypothetical protein